MRALTSSERELLEALLLDSVPGVAQLRAQLACATVRETEYGDLDLLIPAEAPRAQVLNGPVPVDATVVDADGKQLGLLALGVRRGVLTRLEYIFETEEPGVMPGLAQVRIAARPVGNPREWGQGFNHYLDRFCPCCDRPGLEAVLAEAFADDLDPLHMDELHRDLSVLARLSEEDLATCLRMIGAPRRYGPLELLLARTEEWLLAREQPVNYLPCVCPPGAAELVAAELTEDTAILGKIACPDLAFRFLVRARREAGDYPEAEQLARFRELARLFDHGEYELDCLAPTPVG